MKCLVWKNKVYPHKEVKKLVKKLLSNFLDYAFKIANKRGYPLVTYDFKNDDSLEYYVFSENDTITTSCFEYTPKDPIYCKITLNIIKEDQIKITPHWYLSISRRTLFSKKPRALFEEMYFMMFRIAPLHETFVNNNFSSEQIKRYNYAILTNKAE